MDVDGQYPSQFWIVLMPIPSEQKHGSFEYSGELAMPEKAAAAADHMAYMDDLLLELQRMAVTDGHATLAGLLSLAHTEALQRIR